MTFVYGPAGVKASLQLLVLNWALSGSRESEGFDDIDLHEIFSFRHSRLLKYLHNKVKYIYIFLMRKVDRIC